jgi:hypothetical protein
MRKNMKRNYGSLLTLGLFVFQLSISFAAKPSENSHLEILPDETEAFYHLDNMRVSK